MSDTTKEERDMFRLSMQQSRADKISPTTAQFFAERLCRDVEALEAELARAKEYADDMAMAHWWHFGHDHKLGDGWRFGSVSDFHTAAGWLEHRGIAENHPEHDYLWRLKAKKDAP